MKKYQAQSGERNGASCHRRKESNFGTWFAVLGSRFAVRGSAHRLCYAGATYSHATRIGNAGCIGPNTSADDGGCPHRRAITCTSTEAY